MNVKEMALSDITLSYNHRETDRLQDLAPLMASIKETGRLIHPVTVENVNGSYILISGYRRYHACKNLGWKTISASVVTFDSAIDRLIFNHDENNKVKSPSVYELGNCYAALEKEGLTRSEISQRCNVKNGQVLNCLDLFKSLPAYISTDIVYAKNRADVGASKISTNTAYQVLGAARTAGLSNKSAAQTIEFVKKKRLDGKKLASFLLNVKDGSDLENAYVKIEQQTTVSLLFMADTKKVAALEKKYGTSYRNIMLNFLSQYPEFGLNKYYSNASKKHRTAVPKMGLRA